MKKLLYLLGIAVIAASCEGPEGPAGVDGQNGKDGIAGTDANSTCITCHTGSNMDAIQEQYEQSVHGLAATVVAQGTRASCGRCHSHEGFMEYLDATPGVTLVDFTNPSRISCSTCHANHRSLEEGLTAPLNGLDPVTAIADGSELVLAGNSGMCINCHQSRRAGSYYMGSTDTIVLNGTTYYLDETVAYINSTHAGPHYGTQGDILLGVNGYTSAAPAAHAHKNAGCVTCHMGTAGTGVGGHTFTPNIANCQTCHAGATSFDMNGFQTQVHDRLEHIHTALETVGALDTSGHPVKSVVSVAQFKAFWNFKMLEEDRSMGVHNPNYADALLTEAETLLGL